MKTTFTKKFMQENCGCYAAHEGKLESCSFMQADIITLESIIESEIPLKDKLWFVIKKCANTDEQRQIAIEVAECALPIYEAKYQDNKAPRKAIEAAKKYLKCQISLAELLVARRAAYAAYAADIADAAYAAYAANAAATYAADAAVDAAANAAANAAATYAADAAVDAAANAYREKLLDILKSKITEPLTL